MNQRHFAAAANRRRAAPRAGPSALPGPLAAESHPRRESGGLGAARAVRPPGLGSLAAAASSISMTRGTLPSGRSLNPDHSGLSARPDLRQVSEPRPFGAQRAAPVLPRPTGLLLHLLGLRTTAAPGAAAHGRPPGRSDCRPRKPAGVQSRRAAVRTGMGVSSERACGDVDAGSAAWPPQQRWTLHPGRVQ